MPQRITNKDLEAITARINEAVNAPAKAWNTIDGRNVANVGHYYLDGAYGGVSLVCMVNESGGVTNVLRCGYVSKAKLYDLMQAFLTGIHTGKGK
jgi:hypothetical protein